MRSLHDLNHRTLQNEKGQIPFKDIYPLFAWCHLELNQGHTDFQSVALPTELWHLVF